jgi:ubiquinone/menaquinone biosynthesis C-methylase UbiE
VQETPYQREPGYAERYRDLRFGTGHGARTDRLERAALARLLAEAGCGPGPWLDLPSGPGRMSGLLPGPVVRADRDPEMLAAGGTQWPRVCASALALPFADRAFAGVLCLRLLHHVPGSRERTRMLGELARVCRGPVIVSFFDALCLQHLRRVLRRATGKPRSGRSALRRAVFAGELAAAGLRPVRWLALSRFLAEQTLVLALPQRVEVADTPGAQVPGPGFRSTGAAAVPKDPTGESNRCPQ